MKDVANILQLWRDPQADLSRAVLATVVRVQGSAYRRPGARMLLCPDGTRVGSVSGGCLEGDLVKKAWWLTEGDTPVVRTYDTTSDDDTIQVFGLGCNGIVDVLLERVGTQGVQDTLGYLQNCRENKVAGAIATVIRAQQGNGWRVGERMFYKDSSVAPQNWERIRLECGEVVAAQTSRLVHLGACDIFVEYVAPTPQLIIFGAGHDVIPLVSMASGLGWHVTVADGKAPNLRPSRFRTADRLVCIAKEDLLHDTDVTEQSCVVLMTHSYSLDQQLLARLLPIQPKYIGILGPRDRTRRLLNEYGIPANLHSPAGLDIGADGPELIALSILAEIQATVAGRSGSMLHLRQSPIYEPVPEVVAEPLPVI